MAKLTAVLVRDGTLYVAHCPEVGTASQGKTVEEAVANLKEATELYLEEFPDWTPPRPGAGPIVMSFEVESGAAA
ncbi:MAG TPA: type II toxin-antitoxin system HicB family antitoxin [Candidatus Thermoplasmatota archaeon]|nr:type II toxin-antitoxin system HicB family antitoxin [Candidatus Thermoplasmatota archaeon]